MATPTSLKDPKTRDASGCLQAAVRRARRRPSQTATMSRLCHAPGRAAQRPRSCCQSRRSSSVTGGPECGPAPGEAHAPSQTSRIGSDTMWPQARQPTESWFRTTECEPHRGQIIATTSSSLRHQCSRPATAKARTKASGLLLEPVCETSGGAVFVAIPFRAFPLSVEASVHPEGRAELRILPRVADHPAPDHTIAKMVLLCGAPGVQAPP